MAFAEQFPWQIYRVAAPVAHVSWHAVLPILAVQFLAESAVPNVSQVSAEAGTCSVL